MIKKPYLTGFTLIELLVTLTIIGLLIATIAVNYEKVRIKGRDSKRKADIVNVGNALESYYIYNKVYPQENCASSPYTDRSWVDCHGANLPWITGVENYLDPMPKDPQIVGTTAYRLVEAPCSNLTDYNYLYWNSTSLDHYILATRLETANDPDALHPDDPVCPNFIVNVKGTFQPYGPNVPGYPIYAIYK